MLFRYRFGCIRKLRKAILGSLRLAVCVSLVCLSTWNNRAPTGLIFMKFLIENFSKICWGNSCFVKIWSADIQGFVFLGRVTNPSANPHTLRTSLTTPDSRNNPHLQTPRKKGSRTPHETMATRRCRNRSNDLIHGGRWWCCSMCNFGFWVFRPWIIQLKHVGLKKGWKHRKTQVQVLWVICVMC